MSPGFSRRNRAAWKLRRLGEDPNAPPPLAASPELRYHTPGYASCDPPWDCYIMRIIELVCAGDRTEGTDQQIQNPGRKAAISARAMAGVRNTKYHQLLIRSFQVRQSPSWAPCGNFAPDRPCRSPGPPASMPHAAEFHFSEATIPRTTTTTTSRPLLENEKTRASAAPWFQFTAIFRYFFAMTLNHLVARVQNAVAMSAVTFSSARLAPVVFLYGIAPNR
ncbi:hypothetical protein CH63R_02126 [Colletotrichum higginsianum IMI 349063]|uniref:Uncharacterized protein n=1 Tax=Colletotrichum higginsianum (strain IMI 349063) TaxID=759273 RepID=A0A1B7YMX1_COLHI|nr:hypothetical protein CH63R_02126 [Colletotrichum higginsianum IMI 349063]OBR13400.1 hypothetical protein CH63R_02126 [Colletotrichum higginsianum IMI 349063]